MRTVLYKLTIQKSNQPTLYRDVSSLPANLFSNLALRPSFLLSLLGLPVYDSCVR
ncbi:unnamed protein product [Chondrus crispus]|uniref:Uncharacterized protein n=1 Tax=Chondrus crispus TaxID=2769 RepID=R7QQ49_CHOCR|nr:unnamed protein product [Chondrus crispus]CDF40249.1 unnamed protein product [Chondrus crispus]|eukprot:XP_005710543.1 unnamed protein product [Chondrus crispus]